jgi:hypothetical protein
MHAAGRARREAQMSGRTRGLLWLAGGGSLAVALLHVVLAFSLPLCRFCGAPEWVLRASLPLRLSVTLALAAVFGALAAGALRPLARNAPPPPYVLLVIGLVYVLRGLALVPESLAQAGLLRMEAPVAPQMPVFSLISLIIGSAHLAAARALQGTTAPRGRTRAVRR